MNKNRRRPSRIDTERTRIIFCKYCCAKITFGYGTTDKDGRLIPTNPDGTKHLDEGGSQK
jgi:hypothetical protein